MRLVLWAAVSAGAGGVVGLTAPGAINGVAFLVVTNAAILPWLAVRAFGFLAYLALAASVVYGLMLSTKLLDVVAHRPITIALHRDLSIAGLVLTALHGGLLVLDHTYAFTPLSILVPFASPYAALAVGIGQLAGYMALVVTVSFYVRRRISQRAWRVLHYTTFPVYAAAVAHGIASGTDSGTAWAFWLYVVPLAAIAFLFGYRLVGAIAGARQSPLRPARLRPSVGLPPDSRPAAPGPPPAPTARPAAPPHRTDIVFD